MRDTASPFEFDGPVPPDCMINRRSEADVIREWTRESQLMTLVAPRRFGKTSLISKIASEGEKTGLMVVTADLFELASLSDLVLRLERAWAQHTPEELRPAAGKILGGAQAGVSISGGGFALALADRPDTDPEPALHALLELPARLAQHRPGRILIVLDEFQSVAGVPGAQALIWRHAWQERHAVSHLFAGGGPGMLSAAPDDEGRPVEQARTLRLGRLPSAELCTVIKDRFAAANRDVSGVIDGLVAVAEGHPQRTMLLAHLLWLEVSPGERATADDLSMAIAVALRQVDAEARATMSGLTAGQRKVLRAVAEYGTPMAARASRTLGLPKTTAQKAAPHLVATGLIEDTEEGWRVVDPLLARWIRTNYGTRA
ncbi:helix-turn-helix domain-containing protein [Streptomyces sp. NRRL F-5193]|uniref:helix-turn-helix domain-containing protein n=1 Tax=Streptomyces sp. NRRL F-5193 TaxID=1463860 RepID=UPI0005BA0130|nr:helix-turn-helix domain-containing protein [Streptomyces sp. NRRL F-5193]